VGPAPRGLLAQLDDLLVVEASQPTDVVRRDPTVVGCAVRWRVGACPSRSRADLVDGVGG
jgi:hypothetical protein